MAAPCSVTVASYFWVVVWNVCWYLSLKWTSGSDRKWGSQTSFKCQSTKRSTEETFGCLRASIAHFVRPKWNKVCHLFVRGFTPISIIVVRMHTVEVLLLNNQTCTVMKLMEGGVWNEAEMQAGVQYVTCQTCLSCSCLYRIAKGDRNSDWTTQSQIIIRSLEAEEWTDLRHQRSSHTVNTQAAAFFTAQCWNNYLPVVAWETLSV